MGANTKGVAAFLALAFGIAWLFWEVPLWLGVPASSALFQALVVPGAFAPAVAATVVRQWVTREGFADAGLGLKLRKSPYFLFALAMPLAVVAFVAIVAPLLGLGTPDYSLQNGAGLPVSLGPNAPSFLSHDPLRLAVLQMTIWSVLATPILWGEEFGWRSYLQLRMFPSRPLLAAIATGLIWGVWHYPLLAIQYPLHPYLMLAIFPLGTVFYSIFLGWLRIRSGSIWTSSFGHSAINNLAASLIPLLFASQQDRLFLSLLGLVPLALIAAVIVLSGGLKPAAAADTNRHKA